MTEQEETKWYRCLTDNYSPLIKGHEYPEDYEFTGWYTVGWCFKASPTDFLEVPSPEAAKEEKCVAGCMVYTGGERKHHKDCPFYPESFTKMYDDLKANPKLSQDAYDGLVAAVYEIIPSINIKEDMVRIIEISLERWAAKFSITLPKKD
jgi:hypothetical protein